MSYTRQVGDMTINVICKANPEGNYEEYKDQIEQRIKADGYVPKTTMDNLICMVLLFFDNDDMYGEYDPKTGCGGWGDEFDLETMFEYVRESGGWSEFDYYA